MGFLNLRPKVYELAGYHISTVPDANSITQRTACIAIGNCAEVPHASFGKPCRTVRTRQSGKIESFTTDVSRNNWTPDAETLENLDSDPTALEEGGNGCAAFWEE